MVPSKSRAYASLKTAVVEDTPGSSAEAGASSDLLIPLYLLIQPSTSLCQTSEFSGFVTHLHHTLVKLQSIDGLRMYDTYVVLVREHEEPAGDFASLQDVEHGEALGDRKSVVQLVVNNLHG
jgi:hypothetical protein